MKVEEKIQKAKQSLERIERLYKSGELRLALGETDWCEEHLTAAKWLLVATLKEMDQK